MSYTALYRKFKTGQTFERSKGTRYILLKLYRTRLKPIE